VAACFAGGGEPGLTRPCQKINPRKGGLLCGRHGLGKLTDKPVGNEGGFPGRRRGPGRVFPDFKKFVRYDNARKDGCFQGIRGRGAVANSGSFFFNDGTGAMKLRITAFKIAVVKRSINVEGVLL
jgi:hypothetical protein